MGNGKLLHRIRNIGTGRATYARATRTEALTLEIDTPELEELIMHIQVEDMRIPGHQNVRTTKNFQPELPDIIMGRSNHWHLWEARIHRNRLVLNYAEKGVKGRNRSVTALRCYFNWPPELDLTILAPIGLTPHYRIVHLAPTKNLEHLTIQYDDEELGKENIEAYQKRSKEG